MIPDVKELLEEMRRRLRRRRAIDRAEREIEARKREIDEQKYERVREIEERHEARKAALRRRQARRDFQEHIGRVEALTGEANDRLRDTVEAILISFGYRRHKRSEWRLRCYSTVLMTFRDQVRGMKPTNQPNLLPDPASAKPGPETPPLTTPLPKPTSSPITTTSKSGPSDLPKPGLATPFRDPPGTTPEEAQMFAVARAGDATAQERVRLLLLDRDRVDRLGDLGREATRQLIAAATAGDPVRHSFLEEKAAALWTDLLGEKPSVLDQLLARRVINNFIALHWLEERLAATPLDDVEEWSDLDKAVCRAQRRYTESINALAQVRRLQAPKVV